VAIKFLSSARAQSHESVLRFEREARAASALNHPHICTVHEFGLSNDRPFIVMELLDGQTLRDRLKAGPFETPLIVDLGCQIADALEAAHSARIIHRDITPANVFVTRAGHVKILDFGLAKLTPEKDFYAATEHGQAEETHEELLTSPGAALGTTAYMSPEQVRADPLDQRTDLFSFGCVLYEMVTGRRAFDGRTSAMIFDAILRETPVAPQQVNPAVPEDLDRLIQKALEKDPELRYQTAREIRADLLRMVRGSGSGHGDRPASGSGGQRPSSRTGSGRAVPVAVPVPVSLLKRVVPLLVVAVAAGAVAAGSYWLRARPEAPLWASPQQLTTEAGAQYEPALSPDGSIVAFTRKHDGVPTIWLYDIRNRVLKKLTQDGRAERSPAWNAKDGMVYFVADHEGLPAVWKAPRWPGSTPTLVLADADEPAIASDGSRLAFVRPNASGSDRIWVSGLPGAGDAHQVTGEASEYGLWQHREPAWSPDGQRVCYRGQRDLFVVTATGSGFGTPARLTRDDERDEDPVWSQDGSLVYFASFRGNTNGLWTVTVPGGEVRRVTNSVGPEGHPSLSADGNLLVYTSAVEDSNIVLHDLRSGQEHTMASNRSDEMPVFLPDSRAIVFTSNRAEGYRLWRQSVSAGLAVGEAQQVTDQPGSVANPDVSPDGRWVAYYRVHEGQRDIWVAPVAGGRAEQFTTEPAADIHPAWSPDGTRLAFVSDRAGGINQVFVAAVRDGRQVGTPQQITSGTRACWSPRYSPDGASIAYVGSGENGEVFIVPADGRRPASQITRGAFAQRLRWHPTRNTLLVSGGWGRAARLVLREVHPRDLSVSELKPPVVFGDSETLYDFDISSDGRWLALSREEVRGNLCSLTALRGRK
jgi:Tol biopolymer transport system component